MSLVTLALVKEWIQIAHSQQDNVLQLMIDGAESFLEGLLNIKLTSDEHEEDLDSDPSNDFARDPGFGLSPTNGNGAAFLVPSNRPVTAVESVVDLQDEDAEFNFRVQGDLIALTDADGNPLGAWPPGLKRFRVSYTAGYDEDTVPKTIKLAVCMLVKRAYDARDGQNGINANGNVADFGALMDSAIVKMVQPFSRKRMASA